MLPLSSPGVPQPYYRLPRHPLAAVTGRPDPFLVRFSGYRTPLSPPRTQYVCVYSPKTPYPSAGSRCALTWHRDRDSSVPSLARVLLLVVGQGPLPARDQDGPSLRTVSPGTERESPGCGVPHLWGQSPECGCFCPLRVLREGSGSLGGGFGICPCPRGFYARGAAGLRLAQRSHRLLPNLFPAA